MIICESSPQRGAWDHTIDVTALRLEVAFGHELEAGGLDLAPGRQRSRHCGAAQDNMASRCFLLKIIRATAPGGPEKPPDWPSRPNKGAPAETGARSVPRLTGLYSRSDAR